MQAFERVATAAAGTGGVRTRTNSTPVAMATPSTNDDVHGRAPAVAAVVEQETFGGAEAAHVCQPPQRDTPTDRDDREGRLPERARIDGHVGRVQGHEPDRGAHRAAGDDLHRGTHPGPGRLDAQLHGRFVACGLRERTEQVGQVTYRFSGCDGKRRDDKIRDRVREVLGQSGAARRGEIRVRPRSDSASTSRRIGAGATGDVAAIAASRPCAAAMVSRSISVQVAMASVRATPASRSERPPASSGETQPNSRAGERRDGPSGRQEYRNTQRDRTYGPCPRIRTLRARATCTPRPVAAAQCLRR